MDPKCNAWLDRIDEARSLDSLRKAASRIVGELGYRYFIYRGRFTVAGARPLEICLDGRPGNWREWCAGHQIDSQSDPLWKRALRQVKPIPWREVAPRYPSLFGAAADHGMTTGVTHPLHDSLGDWSAMSLVKDRDSRSDQRDIDGAMAGGQLLICFVHAAAARLVNRQRKQPALAGAAGCGGDVALTGRERECLQLYASGMCASELADRLHLSDHAVYYHLKNARRKLGASSSRHAVVSATRLGIIVPA